MTGRDENFHRNLGTDVTRCCLDPNTHLRVILMRRGLMMYLLVKALHVFAIGTFVGGMLAVAVVLRLAARRKDEDIREVATALLRWDDLVTLPALAIVWMAGMAMAFGGGWTDAPWLLLKLIPAVFLSGLHILDGVALKRLVRSGKPVPRIFAAAPPAILFAFAMIAWLAVAKPL